MTTSAATPPMSPRFPPRRLSISPPPSGGAGASGVGGGNGAATSLSGSVVSVGIAGGDDDSGSALDSGLGAVQVQAPPGESPEMVVVTEQWRRGSRSRMAR